MKINLESSIIFLAVDLFDKCINYFDDDINNIDIYLVLIVSISCKYIDDTNFLNFSYIIKCVEYKYDKKVFYSMK